jgi:hypothetical protein
MDMETLLTKEKADAICEKIVRGLEENKIVGSANVIAYAMKESWFAGCSILAVFKENFTKRRFCSAIISGAKIT